ncbi:hypothetical protein LCGC14_1894110 [marine sediment metagenome]|uniref:Uncharacterized protein n=1 Tax=marine sediment metagenome TaxID=412755 RepID=A0A0F9IWM6_9ZZZZ
MSKFDIVVGGDTEFTVHRCGCRDVKRAVTLGRASHYYTVEADTAEQAKNDEIAEYQHNKQDWRSEDFRIMPCCKT